jgi:XTP/dITP diphosphohydrolase
MVLFIASSNPGKLRDFASAAVEYGAAAGLQPVHIEPLLRLAEIPPPPEDEPTFEGNARAKALYYAKHGPGLLVLADDSGLEVKCLDDAPGVRSARYADDVGFPHPLASTPDERNNAALLRALDGVPEACRQARYRCALALARDGEVVATAEGSVDGVILTAPQGTGGFGYDPLFYLPELGKTTAELDTATRLGLNHRGRALRELLKVLEA